MRPLSNSTGSNSGGEVSWSDGDSGATNPELEYIRKLIATANAIPLILIFQAYKIRLDQHNKKTICPFPNHKGGHESTASFNYYPESNSFWCFGCKTGRYAANFVAQMEGISVSKAAAKALNIANGTIDISTLEKLQTANYQEELITIMDFSTSIRQAIRNNIENENVLDCLEKVGSAFDRMYEKYNLDQAALKSLVEKLKERIAQCQ